MTQPRLRDALMILDVRDIDAALPFLFLPVLGCVAGSGWRTGDRLQDGGSLTAVLAFGGYILLIGYLYVGAVDPARSFADDRGWFRQSGSAA